MMKDFAEFRRKKAEEQKPRRKLFLEGNNKLGLGFCLLGGSYNNEFKFK